MDGIGPGRVGVGGVVWYILFCKEYRGYEGVHKVLEGTFRILEGVHQTQEDMVPNWLQRWATCPSLQPRTAQVRPGRASSYLEDSFQHLQLRTIHHIYDSCELSARSQYSQVRQHLHASAKSRSKTLLGI